MNGYWLASERVRVLHAVVWPDGGSAKPLCGNQGFLERYFVPGEKVPERPVCTRCAAEVKRLVRDVQP